MGLYAGHRRQTLDVRENWHREQNGMWQLYQIVGHTAGKYTRHKLNVAITEKEYFIRKLNGEV